MPCPYAERRGALVYCKVIGKTVNPFAFPCLSNKYTTCRYYREARQKELAEEAARRRAREEKAAPARAERPSPPAAGPGKLGLTRDGGIPASCDQCVFFAKRRGWCLILGRSVEDPSRPPCAAEAT